MEKVSCYNPSRLAELSVGSIFGVNCKESIGHLMQILPKEAILLTVLVSSNKGHYTRYDDILEDRGDLFCGSYNKFCYENYTLFKNSEELRVLGLLRIGIEKIISETNSLLSSDLQKNVDYCYVGENPMYQVINAKNTKDIIKSYYDKRNEILSLPEFTRFSSWTSNKEINSYYHDPLCFFPAIKCNYNYNINSIYTSMKYVNFEVDFSISTLKRSHGQIRDQLYHLSMALLLQIKNSVSLLMASVLDREESVITIKEELIMKSLNVVICLRNYADNISLLKGTIFPIIQACNFTCLEDLLEVFERKISCFSGSKDKIPGKKFAKEIKLPYQAEISRINCFLKMRYQAIIARKRIRISRLKKIVRNNDNSSAENQSIPVLVEHVNRSVKMLEDEIEAMEALLNKPPV